MALLVCLSSIILFITNFHIGIVFFLAEIRSVMPWLNHTFVKCPGSDE